MTDQDLESLRSELDAARMRPRFDEAIGLRDEQLYLPEPDDVVKHYKGDLYTIVTVARREAFPDELCVIYKSHARKIVWFRPLGEFVEIVEWPDGRMRPRFCRLLSFDDASAHDARDADDGEERLPCGVRADAGGPL